MQIEILTKSDLEAFKKELLATIAGYFEKNKTHEKEFLRSSEVRKLLNISNGTLMNLRVKGILRATKLEGVYYYRLSEIKALLNAGTQE